MAKIRTSSNSSNSSKYNAQSLSGIKDTLEKNRNTYVNQKELDLLSNSLSDSIAIENALKAEEVQRKKEQETVKANQEIESQGFFSSVGEALANFWDGLNVEDQIKDYHMTPDGKFLKKRDLTVVGDNSNILSKAKVSTNTIEGINPDGTYNTDLWEEVAPSDLASMINSNAKRMNDSNSFHAGFSVGSFVKQGFNNILQGIGNGLGDLANTNLSVLGQGIQNYAGASVTFMNDLELKALDKLGLKDTNYYKELEQGNIKNKIKLVDSANRLVQTQKEREQEIKKDGNRAIASGIYELFSMEENNRAIQQQNNLRSMITQSAIELSGEAKPEILNDAKLPNINTATVDFNGTQIPLETTSGSKYDTKKLILGEDGKPILDENGNPAYIDKYSLIDKFSNANLGNLFTKYGSEDLINAGASSVGFLVGGGITSKMMGNALGAMSVATSALANSTRGLNMLTRLTSKIDDLALGVTSKAGGAQAMLNRGFNTFNKGFQTTLNAYVMTNAESTGIGNDAATNVYNTKVDKAANINVDKISQQIAETNPGISNSEIQLRTEAEVSRRRQEFAKNNPDEISDIIAMSLAAKETATSLNNINTIFNLNFGAAFAKSKSLARDILTNPLTPKSIAKGLYNITGEGIQEYFEEGLFNAYSQRVAELAADSKGISVYDYVNNDFLTKENVTQGLIGMLSGIGQTSVMNAVGSINKIKSYNKQKEEVNSIKEIANANPQNIKTLLELAFDSDASIEFSAQQNALGEEIKTLESQGKTNEAKAKRDELASLGEKMLLNKAVRAASFGTSTELSNALIELSNNKEFTEEQRNDFKEAVNLNEMVADLHDKYLYYHGTSNIIQNRANKFLIDKHLRDYQARNQQTILNEYNKGLQVVAERSLRNQGVDLSTVENYDDLIKETIRGLSIDPMTHKPSEDKLKYDNHVNMMSDLSLKLDEMFYEMTSKKGQQELANKKLEAISKKIIENTTPENVEQAKENVIEETGTISDEQVNQIENNAYQAQVKIPSIPNNFGYSRDNAIILGDDTTIPKNIVNKSEEVEPQQIQHSNTSLDNAMTILDSLKNENPDDLLSDDNNSEVFLFSPTYLYDDKNETHNKVVNALSEAFKKDLAINPNIPLDGAIARFAMDKGLYKVGQMFDLIVEAWGKASNKTLTPIEKKALYNSYFGVDNALQALENLESVSIVPGNNETTASPIVESVPSPVVEIAQTPTNESAATPTREEGINTNPNLQENKQQILDPVKLRGNLTAEAEPKLAFLGLKYNVSEDGQEYTTATTEIQDSAKVFLDPRNFKVGDKHDLTFNFNYLYNPNNTLRIWLENSEGNTIGALTTVEERVSQIFPQLSFEEFVRTLQNDPRSLLSNDEFLKMIPVGIIFEDEVLDGGLNDYYWWNSRNVAGTIDAETKELIPHSENLLIIKGRENNLAIRQALLESESFNLNVEITQNTSKYFNKLLLVTPEEQEQGYSDTFQSVLEAFNNDLDYFRENVAMGFFANSHLYSENKNGTLKLTIGNKEVSDSQITNLTDLKIAIQNEAALNNETTIYNPESGRRVLIAKSGYENGKPVYTAHLVTTNHKSQQELFSKINNVIDILVANNPIPGSVPSYGWVLRNEKNTEELNKYTVTPEYIEEAKRIRDIIKNKFKVDISKTSHDDNFKNFYPQKGKTSDKNVFTQNISTKHKPLMKQGIPNLIALLEDGSTPREAVNKIFKGDLDFITPQELYATTSHTQYIFTPLEKNGDTIYSNVAQKRITFEPTNRESSQEAIDVIQKSLDDAKKEVAFLKQGLVSRPDDTTLKTSLNIAEEKVKNLEVKNEQENESVKVDPKSPLSDTQIKLIEKLNFEKDLEIEEARKNYNHNIPVNRLHPSLSSIIKKIYDRHANNVLLVQMNLYVDPDKYEEESNQSTETNTTAFSESDINSINDEIFSKALAKIDVNNFNKQSILQASYDVFNETLSNLKDQGFEAEANFMTENRNQILGLGIYEGSIKEIIDVTFDLPISEEEFNGEELENGAVNLITENIKDQSKESFEQDIRTSLGMKVKAILSGIEDTRTNEFTFGNFKRSIPLNEVLDFLQQALAESSNNTLESLTETIGYKIEKNPKDFGFYTNILERLQNPDYIESGIVNEILYNLYQSKLQMDFLIYSIDKDGLFTAKSYDANSKSADIVKRNKWKENLKVSPLINRYEEGYFSIDKDVANKVYSLRDQVLEQHKTNGVVDTLKLEELLSYFGISLNPMTMPALLAEQIPLKNANLTDTGFILKDRGLLMILTNNIDKAIKLQDSGKKLALSSEYSANEDSVLFDLLTNDNSNNTNMLIAIDNSLSALSMTSIYVGGKIVNAFTKPNQISNTVKKLKGSKYLDYSQDHEVQEYMKKILNTPITQDSLIAEMLMNEPRFKDYFDVVNISLEALKERGTKARTDREITDLSDKDDFVTLFNMFSHIDGEINNEDYSNRFGGLKFRRGTISFPTLSDSSQKPLMKTALLKLRTEDFTDNSIERLSEEVLDYTLTHLVMPNLRRVEAFVKSGTQVNISGHNVGASFFTDLPSLNYKALEVSLDADSNITLEDGVRTVKLPAIEVFKKYISEGRTIEDFIDKYRTDIHDEIHRNLDEEVDNYISKTGKSGLLYETGIYTEDKINYIDEAYISDSEKETSSLLNTMRLMMYDYVINYMVNQKEIQTLFAGDIANYFKDKHAKNFKENKNSFPVKVSDILNYYYNSPEQKTRAMQLINSKDLDTLLKEFPMFQGSVELFPMFDSHARTEMNLPIQQSKFNKLMEDVQNNLSKRLKALLSPGSQFPNSTGSMKYTQIMVQDVESASEVLLPMAYLKYPELIGDSDFAFKIVEFKEIDDILPDQRTAEQDRRYKTLLDEFNEKYPDIAPFFKNPTTDAQEYTTWRDNLNQLRAQGRITEDQFEEYRIKLEDQSINGVNNSNRLSLKEMKELVMQPSKPLHAGLYYEEKDGYNHQRFVYVKSSSFPLVPQLTEMFPKLNNLRKNMESLETSDKTVRLSYESANKVGGPVNGGLPLSALYKDELSEQEKTTILASSALTLDRSNFYIQQDKPFKSDKNAKLGKEDRVNRATQFEKIILGDGISQINRPIFPSTFSSDILQALDITPVDGKITGEELQKVYNETYKREQQLLKNKLLRELGIESTSEMVNGTPKAMERLASSLNKRLNNKQDRKALELIYYGRDSEGNISKGLKRDLIATGNTDFVKAEFKIPLYMTPNSKKFESVLNAVVNKSLINLKLPGFSSPVASQQGFDIKGYQENTEYKDLITSPNFNPKKGLQATVDSTTGELTHAQVFMANKFKIKNENTGQYDYIDLKDYLVEGTNTLDTNKIPQELLELFSFRIPTSAHQSGVVIEVVGFLPHTVGDMLVVPKDHTTQIGEDYDIDVRYMYQLHYTKKGDALKVLDSEDFVSPRTVDEVRQEFNKFKDDLFNEFFSIDVSQGTANSRTYINNPYWNNNREKLWEIHFLKDTLESSEMSQDLIDSINKIFNITLSENILDDNIQVTDVDAIKARIEELESELIPDNIVKAKKQELLDEYKNVKKDLTQAFLREQRQARKLANDFRIAIDKEEHEVKVNENNIVKIYKSVFSSPDPEVRNLISRVLSTDFSGNTVDEMDKVLDVNKKQVFNVYSPFNQRKILKLGSDGKMGIGVHSNAVTMNSILQQHNSNENGELILYNEDQEGNQIPINITLGKLIFDGKLGQVEKNNRRISESVMESQNSATDNQKLQIMGRRNENKHTINVLAILQATGNDFDGFVLTNEKGEKVPMSYASLFINQPIIRDYVKLMEKYTSSTSDFIGDINAQVEKEIYSKWGRNVPSHYLTETDSGNMRFTSGAKAEFGKNITGQFLYDNLLENKATSPEQWYVYESFLELKGASTHYNRLQRFINIENGGLGISYFDTIDLMQELINIGFTNEVRITNADKLIGDFIQINNKSSIAYLDDENNVLNVEENGEIPETGNYRIIYTPEGIKAKEDEIKKYESMGYIRVQLNDSNTTYMVKPNNHYAHKIVNSITTGYELWNSIFPYDHKNIAGIIDNILDSSKRLSSKEALELKYKAISELKDYIYSNSQELFENNFENIRKDLFFDTSENESLASYLLRLSENPNFKNRLFKQNFFKDLVFDINEDTYPSTIRYNSSDVSKSYNLSIYSLFEKLVDSKTALPDYNGKPYTYELLMKDLLRYSLLADQGNGAIGFRQVLPISLFDKYGVSDSIKLQTDIKNTNIQNIVFNGVEKAVANFFNVSSLDKDKIVSNKNSIPFNKVSTFVKMINNKYADLYGVTNAISIVNNLGDIRINVDSNRNITSTFVRQFFQHNPEHAISLGSMFTSPMGVRATKKLADILDRNGVKYNTDISTISSLSIGNIDGETQFTSDYFTIKDTRGKLVLFERVGDEDNIYVPIPTLGVFGFNEYSVGKYIDKSLVAKNNTNRIVETKINANEQLNYITQNTLSTIINDMSSNGNPYEHIFNFISPFVNLTNQKIKVIESDKGEVFFNNGNIYVNKKWLESGDITNKELQERILEELLHKVSVETLGKFVNFTGFSADGKIEYEVFGDTLPQEVSNLIDTYQEAVDYIINKYGLDKLLESTRNPNGNIINVDSNNPEASTLEGQSLYRVRNIHEFIAGMFLKDEAFAREMSTVASKSNPNTSILGNYLERFLRMVYTFANNFRPKNTINSNTIFNFYNFLINNINQNRNPYEMKIQSETSALTEAQNLVSEAPVPSQESISSPDEVEWNINPVDSISAKNELEVTPTNKNEAVILKKDIRTVILRQIEGVNEQYRAQTVLIPGYKAWFGVIKFQDGNIGLVTDVFQSNQGGNVVVLDNNIQSDSNGQYGTSIKQRVDSIVENASNPENVRKLIDGNDNLTNFENINKC